MYLCVCLCVCKCVCVSEWVCVCVYVCVQHSTVEWCGFEVAAVTRLCDTCIPVAHKCSKQYCAVLVLYSVTPTRWLKHVNTYTVTNVGNSTLKNRPIGTTKCFVDVLFSHIASFSRLIFLLCMHLCVPSFWHRRLWALTNGSPGTKPFWWGGSHHLA